MRHRHAGEGRYPRLSLLLQSQVVDTGLRRHDDVGIAEESIIPTHGIARYLGHRGHAQLQMVRGTEKERRAKRNRPAHPRTMPMIRPPPDSENPAAGLA